MRRQKNGVFVHIGLVLTAETQNNKLMRRQENSVFVHIGLVLTAETQNNKLMRRQENSVVVQIGLVLTAEILSEQTYAAKGKWRPCTHRVGSCCLKISVQLVLISYSSGSGPLVCFREDFRSGVGFVNDLHLLQI